MSHRAGWQRVRTVHVLGGAKGPESRRAVYCPVDEGSKSFEECASCPGCEGISEDPEGKRTLILCTRPADDTLDHPAPATRSSGVRTPIASILRRETFCVRPDIRITELTSLLTGSAIGCVPVVDAGGRPIGIVSRTDLLREKSGVHGDARTAADIMTRTPISIPETIPISDAAAIMAFEGVHHLPVLGPLGRCVGVLSSLDVLRWLARHDGYVVPDYTHLQHEETQ